MEWQVLRETVSCMSEVSITMEVSQQDNKVMVMYHQLVEGEYLGKKDLKRCSGDETMCTVPLKPHSNKRQRYPYIYIRLKRANNEPISCNAQQREHPSSITL